MDRFNSIVLTAFVLVFSALFIFMPKSDFSENENRMLKEFPKLEAEELASGEYALDITEYISDHFPFRDGFVTLKTLFEKNVLKSRYINSIYVCDDEFYIEDYKKPEATDRIINTLNKFNQNLNGKTAELMLVPTAVTIYEDKLPAFAQPLSQLETIAKIYSSVECNAIDVYDELMSEKDRKQLFYKLDHHWTTDGAYCAYTAFCNAKGFEPLGRDEFDIKTVTDDFKGTIYSKLNDVTLEGEKMKVYERASSLTVSYDGRESTSLYNYDYLNEKDKYSLFLNNINSFVEITNNDIDSDRSIAVAKDSYANCFIPFLVNHYKKIYVFDTRSYKGAVSDFVNENDVDDVLVLYNINTIDEDTGINVIY